MVKALFLYNPKAGDRSITHKLNHIVKRFQAADVLLVPYRMFDNDCTEKNIRELLRSAHFSFILLFGGDGSLNYMANLIIKNGISLPMGIFPCGTCNDFSRNLGMTNDLDQWIDMVLSGHTRYIDIGCINDHHYFIGNLGGGMFADVSFSVSDDLKKKLGPAAYYLKALDELPNIESFNITLDTENCRINEKIILFIVLNGKNVAGFSDFFQQADIEDGLLDILLFKNARPMELAGIFMKILAKELSEDKNIIHLRAKEVRLQSDKKIRINVDGEMGTILPVKVHCVHPGLRLFIRKMGTSSGPE